MPFFEFPHFYRPPEYFEPEIENNRYTTRFYSVPSGSSGSGFDLKALGITALILLVLLVFMCTCVFCCEAISKKCKKRSTKKLRHVDDDDHLPVFLDPDSINEGNRNLNTPPPSYNDVIVDVPQTAPLA